MNLKVDVRGERCSGTNYLYSLLKNNFPDIQFSKDFGWKHDFLDVRTPKIYEQEKYLMFIIFRNPYDWVQSLHKNPHHIHPKLRNKPFSEFIRSEWHSIIEGFDEYNLDGLSVTNELLLERNPITLEKIENVLQLRNYKNKNFLGYKHIFDNIEYVNLEYLQNNWEEYLKLINNKYFRLENFSPKNQIYYKGNSSFGEFIIKKYNHLNDEDIVFIQNNLCHKTEELVGYKI